MANRILGQSYGWGGLYETDCSAALKDLLSFGLWLPETLLSIRPDLFQRRRPSNSDKERMILKTAPFT